MESCDSQIEQMKVQVPETDPPEAIAFDDFHIFFNLSTELFCIRKPDGYFSTLNPRWERVLGWTLEELRSRPWHEFIHPDDLSSTLRRERGCGTGKVCYLENRYRHKNGDYFWLSWQIWQHQNGSLYASVREIDDRKKIAQKCDFLQECLNGFVNPTNRGIDAIFHQSKDGTCLDFIPVKNFDLFLPTDELLGKKVSEVFPSELATPVMAGIEGALETGEIQVFEYQLPLNGGLRSFEVCTLKKGEDSVLSLIREVRSAIAEYGEDLQNPFTAEIASKPALVFGEQLLCQSADRSQLETQIHTDDASSTHIDPYPTLLPELESLRDRSGGEEGIRQLNAQLERRVLDRTAELEAANRELEAFCYSVSHDLRAPLRAIAGFSKALLEDYHSVLDDTGKDYLNRVGAATQRMKQSIDSLLALSRVTRTQMQRQPIDLSEMARSIAAEMQQIYCDRQVKFDIAENIIAHADPHLLQVLLENLLGNAWKFTSKTPNPCIEFGVADPLAIAENHFGVQPTASHQTVYFVRDNGAGFDMNYAERLFVPFQRLHHSAQFEGTGIGLATVARIVHRHGGQVWAIAAVGEGATFYFTL